MKKKKRKSSFILIGISLLALFFTSSLLAQNNYSMTSLNDDWFIYPSDKIAAGGSEIASNNFDSNLWYKTDVPKTVFAALVENGVFKDPLYNKNLTKISEDQFKVPWWYRKEFELSGISKTDNYQLILEGINYKAELWVNGNMIAGEDELEGAFGIFEFDITNNLEKGKNTIAVKIIPPVSGDLTIGFVDWNPTPPDKLMGLWRGVKLKKTGRVSLDDVFVQTDLDNETYNHVQLTISGQLKNYSNEKVNGTLSGKISDDITFFKNFTLEGNESKLITITPEDDPALAFYNPRLWYPNNLGEPNLYDITLNVKTGDEISDCVEERFGIREVEDFINEEGYRGYKVNGKKVVIKGGGWVDDIFLNDSDAKVRAQVEYAKQMNLNTIRLEGFWGRNKTLYDAADENGILLMVGWSCQWEWTGYCGREETEYMCIDTPKDVELHTKQFNQQVKWLRNHPSIFVWVFGSDKYPSPPVQEKLVSYLSESDPTRPTLISCQDIKVPEEENVNNIYEDSRVKMYGPYDYEPPVYWYVDTANGGAYGFNTETGPGPQIPPLESLKKMMPEEKLWPINSFWDYHGARNEFENINTFLEAFNNRYGKSETLEEFAFKAQMSNYEAIRPMFEAFSVNKFRSTGVIQWMYNSAWPALYWQLFDYYLNPNGAFYGTLKANQPLNLVYNYGDKNIYLVNDYNKPFNGLSASIKVLDANSKVLFEKKVEINCKENSSQMVMDLSEINSETNLYFVNLELMDHQNNLISDNFYWLSTVDDVLDFEKTEWYFTPIKQFGDLTEINNLPEASISYKYNFMEKNGKVNVDVILKNTSDKVAFFIDLKMVNKDTNENILPIFWSDNYISLLPNSEKNVSASFEADENIDYELLVKGWNTKIE